MAERLGLTTALLRVACEDRMILRSKHARERSEALEREKEAKQHRPYESPTESPHCVTTEESVPSEREIKAAVAARERLYGGKAGDADYEEAAPRLPTGPEPMVAVEVEYPATADLQPLEAVGAGTVAALEGMADPDWTVATPALVTLRQVVVHHKDEAWERMSVIMPLVLKAVKSLRSSLSKSAIMAVADIVEAFGDDVLPHLDVGGVGNPGDSLLYQLLLKGSSNDKRFVIEEAKRALALTAGCIAPMPLLDLLLPYAAHKSPKVRGASAVVVSAAAERMSPREWREVGLEKMLGVAGKLVSDNTPEARNAAKKVIGLLKAAYDQQSQSGSHLRSPLVFLLSRSDPRLKDLLVQAEEKENAPTPINSPRDSQPAPEAAKDSQKDSGRLAVTWEALCKQNLGASQALAVLKAA